MICYLVYYEFINTHSLHLPYSMDSKHSEERYIYTYKDETDKLIQFDTATKEIKTITMQKVFPILCSQILFHSRLFLIGAAFFNSEKVIPEYQSDSSVRDSVWEVDLAAAKLVQKSPMLCKKFAIALCHDDVYIYAIGGDYLGNGYATTDAEAYNVAENKWY